MILKRTICSVITFGALWLACVVLGSLWADDVRGDGPLAGVTGQGVNAVKTNEPRFTRPSESSDSSSQQRLNPTAPQFLNQAQGASQREQKKQPDPFKKNAYGVQTYFPAVAKIVGCSRVKTSEDGAQTIPYFYGTGVFVAQYRNWGLVLTNWHVVSETDQTLNVVFPSGAYSARVILRDETWDLAALLIAKPRGVDPLPISCETPRLGDTFWVGGYGQSSGLADFRMGAGKLVSYVSLVTADCMDDSNETSENDHNSANGVEGNGDALVSNEKASQNSQEKRGVGVGKAITEEEVKRLPDSAFSSLYETLSIKQGVRQGDSGGPIFNRYGELAGILWGSDGNFTMGTACLRMQSFLTQAIQRAARIYAHKVLESNRNVLEPDSILTWELPRECPLAEDSNLDMTTAFKKDRVYPIADRPLYVSPNLETAENLSKLERKVAVARVERAAFALMRKNNVAVPPSPPIYSPSFVVSQLYQKCVHPEVADPESIRQLDDFVMAEALKERENKEIQEANAFWNNAGSSSLRVVKAAPSESDLQLSLGSLNEPKLVNVSDEKKTDDEKKSSSEEIETEQVKTADASAPSASKQNGEEQTVAASDLKKQESFDSKDALNENPYDVFPHERGRLSKLNTYVVVVILVLLFCFAVRLLQDEPEKKPGKTRLPRK